MAKKQQPTSTLYYGDNLDVLRLHIKDESVDLIYLDPPFNSKQDYNVLFADQDGTRSPAQIKVFDDTWHWDKAAAAAYEEVVEAGERPSRALQAFRIFLGENDMLAYLCMMAPRLIELRRKLKSSGSIYLHCDPTASHYLKMLMDSIFGPACFRNEIVWHYRRWTATSTRFQKLHDIILYYAKGQNPVFNQLYTPYTKGSVERKEQGVLHRFKKGEEPVLVSIGTVSKDGVAENDVWRIPFIAPSAKERLGYPTQKPEKLLERIIQASSNEGDVVLDPFCGCGTAVAVAERLKRKWVGIDITHLAVALIKHRLTSAFGASASYRVIGEPVTLAAAKQLAKDDKYQFQWWALGLVGARPTEQKKGADKGIDGRLYFHDEAAATAKTKQVIISVKGGKLKATDLRDLVGVVAREKAAIGVFLTMNPPTKPMRAEAASAGFYKTPSAAATSHPKIQILTIEELFGGKTIDLPAGHENRTFKKAQRVKATNTEQRGLDYE